MDCASLNFWDLAKGGLGGRGGEALSSEWQKESWLAMNVKYQNKQPNKQKKAFFHV